MTTRLGPTELFTQLALMMLVALIGLIAVIPLQTIILPLSPFFTLSTRLARIPIATCYIPSPPSTFMSQYRHYSHFSQDAQCVQLLPLLPLSSQNIHHYAHWLHNSVARLTLHTQSPPLKLLSLGFTLGAILTVVALAALITLVTLATPSIILPNVSLLITVRHIITLIPLIGRTLLIHQCLCAELSVLLLIVLL